MKKNKGKALKEIREKRGLTQTQLGKKLGVRYNTVCGWETGVHKIPTNRLDEICEILDIPPSYLLDEEPTTIEYPYEVITSKKKVNIKEIMPAGANYILMDVKDEGMKCLGISNKDQAIIDTNDKQPYNGSIYALSLGNGIILRKAKQLKNEIIIVSCGIKDCNISVYHKSEVNIIGKVIRIVRKF